MKWLTLLFVICSCTPMKSQLAKSQSSIHDIYVLIEAHGQIVKGKINKQSTLEINLTDMKIMGNDGCNDFSGKIARHTPSEQRLEFAELIATEMYCDEVSNKVGNSFYNVKKYQREGMILKLLSEDDKVLLTYEKVD